MGSFSGALDWLKPREHFDHPFWEIGVFIVVGAALALGATIGVAWAAGFGNVYDRIKDADLAWIPIAFAGQVVAYLGYMIAYREVARVESGPELSVMRLAAVVMSGFGVFVASGGFAIDVAALRRAGSTDREARVRVLGLGALEYALLAPAACVSAIILLAHQAPIPHKGLTLPWAIGVPVGFAVAFFFLRHRDWFAGSGGWKGVVSHALDGVAVLWHLARSPVSHGSAFAGMALYWAGEIFSLAAALHAFHSTRPAVAALIIGFATGYALTRRTLPLAGAGVVEALLPYALVWVGATLAPAVLAVFVYRLFNLWLPLIPAVIGIRALRRRALADEGQRPPARQTV
jgi:uncharacterized membrane protein YbhN (UPF0104 family)